MKYNSTYFRRGSGYEHLEEKYNTNNAIYLIKSVAASSADSEYYKIGITKNNFLDRMCSVQRGTPFIVRPVIVALTKHEEEIEAAILREFSSYRVHSKEWMFLPSTLSSGVFEERVRNIILSYAAEIVFGFGAKLPKTFSLKKFAKTLGAS